MIYELELNDDVVEETKMICCVKDESAVDHGKQMILEILHVLQEPQLSCKIRGHKTMDSKDVQDHGFQGCTKL